MTTDRMDAESLEFWMAQWKRAVARSAWAGKRGYAAAETWNRMSKDYDKGADGQRRPNRDGKPLVKLLLDRGILREGMRVLEDLWRHLLGKAMPPNQWDITLAFNLLRSMGYAPSISFHDIVWKHCQPVSEATAFFTELLHPWLDNPSETVHEKITAFLEERAEDGTVCRRTTGQIGTMTWRRDET